MKKLNLTLLLSLSFIILNAQSSKEKQKIIKEYDFSCLSSDNDVGSNDVITILGDITREMQNDFLSNIEVTVEEEMEFGNIELERMKEEYRFEDSGDEHAKLQKILSILTSKLAEPRGFRYQIHYIDDNIENVFTIGGRIFFFRGMYEKCRSDSEIAAIIGHEISHNELGHLTLKIKKIKSAMQLGMFGSIALAIESVMTVSFNQKQESHADMFGVDLTYPTNYKSCAAVSFWNRMGEEEHENQVENFFRSHPYSSARMRCISNHLETHYNLHCN